MSNFRIVLDGDYIFLYDYIIFNNVVSVYDNGIVYFEKFSVLKIDFFNLKVVDSSIFVLILSWIKKAAYINKSIYFFNIPQFVMNLGLIYDIDLFLLPYLK